MNIITKPNSETKIWVDLETGKLHCKEKGQEDVVTQLPKGVTPNDAMKALREFTKTWKFTKIILP